MNENIKDIGLELNNLIEKYDLLGSNSDKGGIKHLKNAQKRCLEDPSSVNIYYRIYLGAYDLKTSKSWSNLYNENAYKSEEAMQDDWEMLKEIGPNLDLAYLEQGQEHVCVTGIARVASIWYSKPQKLNQYRTANVEYPEDIILERFSFDRSDLFMSAPAKVMHKMLEVLNKFGLA